MASEAEIEAAFDAWFRTSATGNLTWRESMRAALDAAAAVRARTEVSLEPGAFPQLPDDDADFTPELARKIIRIYQFMLSVSEGNRDE